MLVEQRVDASIERLLHRIPGRVELRVDGCPHHKLRQFVGALDDGVVGGELGEGEDVVHIQGGGGVGVAGGSVGSTEGPINLVYLMKKL